MGDFLRAEVARTPYLPAGDVLRAFRAPRRRAGADRRPGPLPDPRAPGRPVVLGRARRAAGAAQPAEHLPRAARPTSASPPPPHGDLTAVDRPGRDAAQPGADRAAGQPGSHRGKGWEAVTEQAIRALVARGDAARRDPVGPGRRDAAAAARRHPGHRVGPPQPASADRGFFGSRPFSRANALLAEQGAAPVDWSLA